MTLIEKLPLHINLNALTNDEIIEAFTTGEPVWFDTDDFNVVAELLSQTADEMSRQVTMWGEQAHPQLLDAYASHKAGVSPLTAERYDDLAAQWKGINDVRAAEGALAWDGIILEEVFEALAETDPAKAIIEHIQAAACHLAAAKSISLHGLAGAA